MKKPKLPSEGSEFLNESENLNPIKDSNDATAYFDDSSYKHFTKSIKKEGFKLYGTRFFLTYKPPESITNFPLEKISDFFKNKFENLFVKCIVCYEKSQINKKHIHVYLELNKRKYFSLKEVFDLELGGVKVKGHYLTVQFKNLESCIKYVKKDGDFYDSCPEDKSSVKTPNQIVTKKFLKKEISRLLTLHWGDLLKLRMAWEKLLLEDYPEQGLSLYNETITTWEKMRKTKILSTEAVYDPAEYELERFRLPSLMVVSILLLRDFSLIVESTTGMGKTSAIKTIGQLLFGLENVLTINNIADLKDIKPSTALVILDDLGGSNADIKDPNQWLHVLDPQQGSKVRVLYGTAPLKKGLARIFTTNNFTEFLEPDKFSSPVWPAVARRFCHVRVMGSLINPTFETDRLVLKSTNQPIYRNNEGEKEFGTSGVFTAEMFILFLNQLKTGTLKNPADINFLKEGVLMMESGEVLFSNFFKTKAPFSRLVDSAGLISKIRDLELQLPVNGTVQCLIESRTDHYSSQVLPDNYWS